MGVKVREKVKGSGEWWIFINFKGQRKSKKAGSKKTAIKSAEIIKAKLVLGEFSLEQKKIPTFGELAEGWLKTTLPATCKSSTISDYKGLLNNHIYPAFKNKLVTDIKRLTVKNFLMEKLNEGKSPSRLI